MRILKTHLTTTYTYIPRVPPTVSVLSSEFGPPTPSLASEYVRPLNLGGGGTHSPAGEGVGESQFGRLEKKPMALCAPEYSFCIRFQHNPVYFLPIKTLPLLHW